MTGQEDWGDIADRAVNAYGAQQSPAELTGLLALLASRRTARIVEIGTWAGGLTWALAQLPGVQTVVTVDRKLQDRFAAGAGWDRLPVVYIQGDSTDPYTRDKVVVALGNMTADVLVIDGGHDYHTAKSDWQMYTPVVSDHGLVVMHDTQGWPGNLSIEVPTLWEKIRSAHCTLELVATPGGPHGTGIVWP